MGGMIARQFALNYPHLTHGVVLVATTAKFNENPAIREFSEQVMQLTDPVPYDFAQPFQAGTCNKPVDKAYLGLMVRESLKVPAFTWKSILKHLLEADFTPELDRLNLPALIIGGDADGFFGPAEQQLLHKAIPQSGLIMYQGNGHALHWEDPARFADDLVNFFSR